MLANVPVYSTQNNTHFVNIYAESDDGTFRRTQSEPLRLLRDDIAGISMSQGELVSQHYDRHDRSWTSATVSYHYGRPQSFYQFLREKVAQNKFFVFSKPTLSGHLIKFDVHELKLKSSMSQRKIAILKEKYLEALDLWSREEYEARKAREEQARKEEQARIARLEYEKTQKIKLVRVNPQDHPPRSDNQADGNTHRGVNRNSEHPRGQSHAPGTAASAKPKKVVDLKAVENARRQVLSDQAQAKVSAQLAGKQSDAPEPPETTPAAEPEQENPFGGKTASRHSHFLRRFLFHRH